jgi:hypothetical protein
MQSDKFLYSVATLGSLSEAASIMTLLALSSSFLTASPEGFASSSIQSMYYLGVGCVGFFGGGILQKWTFRSIGIVGPIISAAIVFLLACFESIDPFIGLPSIFLIFLLTGVAHPNTLRFFNRALEESQKLSFFSLKEGITAILTIAAPVLASFLITFYGTRTCFIIDGCTYLISCLPWLFFSKRKLPSNNSEVRWLVGFREIFRNTDIRSLTLGRLFNNIAYVFCTTSIPLIIARRAEGNTDFFAFQQGLSSSLLSAGFITASFLGTRIAKRNNVMVPMIYLAPALAFGSVLLFLIAIIYPTLLYFGAVSLGIGTYCFRLSGMTLGQSFTPQAILGPVIIAGDTIVRIWSFLISLVTLWIFEFCDILELSFTAFAGLAVIFPSFCLLAPIWMRQLAKQFVNKNSSSMADHGARANED